MTELLSKEHRILEKGCMEYRPFGVTPDGEKIRDVSGVTVRANVEYLEEYVARKQGPEAGAQAVDTLCRLLNERIRDPAYHVTPAFLKNVWHSYSYEFVCFLGELCRDITNDRTFQYRVGQEKFLPLTIQILARPLRLSQIYRMFPHFGEKFAKGSIHFGVGTVTSRSAVLRMKFTDKVYEQFGPYRRRCAELICQSAKAGLAAVPTQVHRLKSATILEHTCIADGAEYCEWEFRWTPQPEGHWLWGLGALLTGGGVLAYLRLRHPQMTLLEGAFFALIPRVGLAVQGAHLSNAADQRAIGLRRVTTRGAAGGLCRTGAGHRRVAMQGERAQDAASRGPLAELDAGSGTAPRVGVERPAP